MAPVKKAKSERQYMRIAINHLRNCLIGLRPELFLDHVISATADRFLTRDPDLQDSTIVRLTRVLQERFPAQLGWVAEQQVAECLNVQYPIPQPLVVYRIPLPRMPVMARPVNLHDN